MQYNELGQEIERILPGDVISKWQYDVTGRPTHHRINSQNRDTRRRVYNWDVNHRLRSMVNELTGVKVTYGYDEFSNLVWSNQGGQFDFLHRSVDDVGNLYETKEKTDRVYGAGSRLLETREATFSYDDEGNLVQKVEKNGDTWKYEYYGNGMMSKVVCYSQNNLTLNKEITFKYDPLGRRVEKNYEGKNTHFVWDSNTVLHEWVVTADKISIQDAYTNQQGDFVTWVYDDNSLTPSAKITNEGNFSIISDYIGTPLEAYDEEGNLVWSIGLDIYGRVKELIGYNNLIPFRFQGQYMDEETGLYYNRFRYYSPNEGIYTQQDPIGLAGNNPTLYGYVRDSNIEIDLFGLAKANGGNAPKHGSNNHNKRIDDQIQKLKQDPDIRNIRKNQQQVDANGNKVGNNRPDIQYDKHDIHHNIEYDTSKRGSLKHQNQIPVNDPNSRNTYEIIDKKNGQTLEGHSQLPKNKKSRKGPC